MSASATRARTAARTRAAAAATLGFKKACGCPTGAGHWACAIAACICPVDVVAGLEDGQGAILADQIKRARARFEAAGNQNPPMAPIAPMAQPPMMGQQMGGQPMMEKQPAPGPPAV